MLLQKTFLLFLGLLCLGQINAQNIGDAVRYSQFDRIGTARSLGVANSMSAIGGDFSAVGYNPAGLATYRFNEVIFSTGYLNAKTTSLLINSEGSNDLSANNLGINNAGVVFVYKPVRGKLKSTNLSIGYNRLANFNQSSTFSGKTVGSITQRFIELATGFLPNELDNFESGPAFDAFAIFDAPADSGEYFSDIGETEEVQKSQRIESTGSMNEISFAVAGNFNHKLYIGASINIPFLEYRENKLYEEADPNDEITIFNSLSYEEDLYTSGSGINFHLGLIYLLTKKIKIGASVKSPTFLGLTDIFSTNVFYSLTDPNDPDLSGDRQADSPEGNFEYGLRTPWRMNASFGAVLGKSGFISAEVELVDYKSNNFNLTRTSSNPGDAVFEEQLNGELTRDLTSALNIKVGGEIAFNNFRVRTGVGLRGSPYDGDSGFNINYNAGAGVRVKRFFADFGFQISSFEQGYLPYVTEFFEQPFVETKTSNNQLLLTLGYKF